MANSQRPYSFYNSLTLTGLYASGYCSLRAGEDENPVTVVSAGTTLVYVDDGSLEVTAKKISLALSKGKALFIPAGEEISLSLEEKAKVLYCVFKAEEELTAIPVLKPVKVSVFGKALLSQVASATKNLYGANYLNSEASLQAFKDFLTATAKISENSDTEHGQKIKNCLELLILDSIKPAYKSIKSGLGDDGYMFESEKLAEKITSFISTDLGREMTLDELSEKFFFSKAYLKRVYKKQTGVGIMQARTEFKIKKAKKLLSEGKSTEEISKKLGFSSAGHFSSTFKKKCGISPTEYKKSLHF